jgi:NADPH:quinone reductase-like Zn-dependent oxidoreductase/acyl carrier protein
LWIVTRGAVPAGGTVTTPAGALLWGVARVLSLENRNLRVHCLDLDPDDPAPAATLCEELALDSAESQIAWRGPKRFVARLTPHHPATGPVGLALTAKGSLDGLTLQPLRRRPPRTGEIEVRVQAAGLNFRDVLTALGVYPGGDAPPGLECAGEVAAIGPDVSGFSEGDRVLAMAPGAFAHFTMVPAVRALHYAGLEPEEAATVPSAFLTAVYALEMLADLRPGERVLIHAASGAVGHAAVQIALRRGAEVFATAGIAKQATLRASGVHHIFDSRSLSFAREILDVTAGQGVHVVLNSLTGEGSVLASFSVLARHGRFIELGARGAWSKERAAAHRPDVEYVQVDAGRWLDENPAAARDLLRRVLDDIAAGTLRPIPHTRFPLENAREAFRTMQRAQHTGKILICPDPLHSIVRPDATYLITGGLGGLGLRLAAWLSSKGARHFALVQRSAAARSGALDDLRRAGAAVRIFPCDVADARALADALDQVRGSMPPLAGVFHLAGSLDDAPAHLMTRQQFENVLGAKAFGAWHLHSLTLADRLDWFVLFSAAAGVLGNPGQANHASANTYLDALAHFRRSIGLPAFSLDLGAVAEIGAAARLGFAAAKQLDAAGVGSIPPDGVFAALDGLLAGCAPQVLLCPIDWARFRAGSPEPLYEDLVAQLRRGTSPIAAAQPGAPRLASKSDLAGIVSRELASVLHLDPREIDPKQPFFDLGLDSLTTLELRTRLQSVLGVDVSSTFPFEFPTLSDLYGFLAARLFQEPVPAERPSAEDIARLLEEELRGVREESHP